MNGPCAVCGEWRELEYCGFCKKWLCASCRANPIARGRAAARNVLGKFFGR